MPKRYAIMIILAGIFLWYTLVNTSIEFNFISAYASQKKPVKTPVQKLIISRDVTKLPKNVQTIHADIIAAARSGDLERIRSVLEKNEILPIVNFSGETDPIAYWRSISKDGTGRDIMAIIVTVFEIGYAVLKPGTKEENYVWPYLAELPISKLNPRQQVDLYRLVSVETAKQMTEKGKYSFFQANIGRDGTWHSFVKEE